jgi:hypothetical protein
MLGFFSTRHRQGRLVMNIHYLGLPAQALLLHPTESARAKPLITRKNPTYSFS